MAEDYTDQFLSLLHNRPGSKRGEQFKSRNRGFVVIVPGNKSLAPLEALCVEQTYNRCFTARYRVSADAVFGTVLTALARDLNSLTEKGPTQGVFFPPPELVAGSMAWDGIRNLIPREFLEMEEGILPVDTIRSVLDRIDRMTGDAVGLRFVLFCEVVGEYADIDEWEQARAAIFPYLPERVGLVFSGAPENFRLLGGPEPGPLPDSPVGPEATSQMAMP